MYIHCSLLSVVLTISWLARVSSYTDTSNNLLLDQLTKSCPSDGIPVCGIRDNQFVLFSNECLLNEANKYILESETSFRKTPLQHCMYGCKFSCPKLYKPVCGQNIKTYHKQLFRNQCELMKYVCKTNMDWHIVNNGMCPEDYSRDRRRKDKPESPHLIQKRSFSKNMYNQFQSGNEYNSLNFVNDKNELHISPNDLYVYMQPTFQTHFIDHDVSSYQHSIPENKGYDEILSKMVTFSPGDITFPVDENKVKLEETILEQSTINPLTFAINGMNLNYLAGQDLALDTDTHSIPPAKELVPDDAKKEYYYSFGTLSNIAEMKNNIEIPTTVETTQIPKAIPGTDSLPKLFDETKQLEEVTEKNMECNFGSDAICATLADGTTRTFATICAMMADNVYFKKGWTKLHEGSCEHCKHNCSRDYHPVCISRNGVNYTMINECYYNLGICVDKSSKWQKLSNNECERYTRIPNTYVNSNNSGSQTTAVPTSDSLQLDIPDESLKASISKNRRPTSERAIRRRFSSQKCCGHDNVKCKYCSNTDMTTEAAYFEQSLYEPQTESHIMRLVKIKDKGK